MHYTQCLGVIYSVSYLVCLQLSTIANSVPHNLTYQWFVLCWCLLSCQAFCGALNRCSGKSTLVQQVLSHTSWTALTVIINMIVSATTKPIMVKPIMVQHYGLGYSHTNDDRNGLGMGWEWEW